MEIIDYKDIDLKHLPKFDQQGKENSSVIYEYNDNELLKLFKYYSSHERLMIFKKFEELENIQIEGIIKPRKFVVDSYVRYGEEQKDIKGYTMEKFADSTSIIDHFGYVRAFNCSDLFITLKYASLILKDMHDNGIICQDISYLNVLFDIDDYSNVKICDLDACSFKKYNTEMYAYDLKEYYVSILHSRFIPSTPNSDKLSMILSLFFLLFRKELYQISDSEYDELASKINTLSNLKDYFKAFKNGSYNFHNSELPYLHEVIDDCEKYVYENKIY